MQKLIRNLTPQWPVRSGRRGPSLKSGASVYHIVTSGLAGWCRTGSCVSWELPVECYE